MRGEIAFTFDEIAKLAYKLNFTVDSIIGVHNKEVFFSDMKTDKTFNSNKDFLLMIKDHCDCIEQISKTQDVEVITSLNRFNLFFLAPYDHLFMFYYYKWIHQAYNIPVTLSFSETVIPPEILELRRHFQSQIRTFNHCSFIIDRHLFLNIVREIQYYHRRNLISMEEVLILQKELLKLLDYIESLMHQGCNEAGYVFNFYLSLLTIDVNTSFASFKGGTESMSLYWMHSTSPIVVKNQEICKRNKKWLE
jgi:hypothetical protein